MDGELAPSRRIRVSVGFLCAGSRAPAFEVAEGAGVTTGLLDGPLALAAALLAAGSAASPPGQVQSCTSMIPIPSTWSSDTVRCEAACWCRQHFSPRFAGFRCKDGTPPLWPEAQHAAVVICFRNPVSPSDSARHHAENCVASCVQGHACGKMVTCFGIWELFWLPGTLLQ